MTLAMQRRAMVEVKKKSQRMTATWVSAEIKRMALHLIHGSAVSEKKRAWRFLWCEPRLVNLGSLALNGMC